MYSVDICRMQTAHLIQSEQAVVLLFNECSYHMDSLTIHWDDDFDDVEDQDQE